MAARITQQQSGQMRETTLIGATSFCPPSKKKKMKPMPYSGCTMPEVWPHLQQRGRAAAMHDHAIRCEPGVEAELRYLVRQRRQHRKRTDYASTSRRWRATTSCKPNIACRVPEGALCGQPLRLMEWHKYRDSAHLRRGHQHGPLSKCATCSPWPPHPDPLRACGERIHSHVSSWRCGRPEFPDRGSSCARYCG